MFQKIICLSLCLFLTQFNPTLVHGQSSQMDPVILLELDGLAAQDPATALPKIEAALAALATATPPDPRVVFDLNRLKADILIRAGEAKAAADLVAQLAGFAITQRAVLERDPVPLFAEAARLYETAGNLRLAKRALQAKLNEEREGGQKQAVIADTLRNLSRIATSQGDTQAATEFDTALKETLSDQEVGTRGDDKGYREVDVYYATDRARSGKPHPSEFYGGDRGELEMGVATVTIPVTHRPGIVEAPSIWRLEFGPSPSKHVVLQSVTPVDPASFFGKLQTEFGGPEKREGFVFVHGYNVGFAQAAKRAAQIAYDMNYFGVPILYSWPSRASTTGYVADTAVVRLSGRRLSLFLDDLVEKSGAQTLHIVAHSMGNRAVTDALELMALRRGLKQGDAPVFGQIVFAAPDVDAGLFREMLKTIRPIAKRLTLYASKEDWALVSSRKLHGNAPRAGQGGDDTLASNNIDSIDMSELGEDMLAHSYFADDSSALADMMALFWQNASPQSRCGLVEQRKTDTEISTWQYQRGQCSERNLIDILAHVRAAKADSIAAVRTVLAANIKDSKVARELEPVILKLIEK